MFWKTVLIVACLTAASASALAGHGGLVCLSCHRQESVRYMPLIDGCTVCHKGHGEIFDHAMAQRRGERQFVNRTYARFDSAFWEKNCDGCHISGCRDCHGNGDEVRRPTVSDCQTCHKGYYVGWDYSGRAPREDNTRYQRGVAVNGETFLKMLPDVHQRAGMTCGACHSMASLARGLTSSKGCRDCHTPSRKPVEHRIAAHLKRMECSSCHAGWAAQEYGTFFLRFRNPADKDGFDLKPGPSSEYLRSAYLRSQDAPPLGLNSRGMVSPIRPMLIAYYTDIMSAKNGGPENIRLAAEWRAFQPHTIQRGSVGCEGCHDTPRRFLLEPETQRVYLPERDGLGLASFWRQEGQQMVNGNFMGGERYRRMGHKNLEYTRGHVEKWKDLLRHVESSSPP